MCHCSQKAINLMHCQGCKQEDKTSDCFPFLAFLKPHLGYCVQLGSPSMRVILTNCSESGQEGCCSSRPVPCRGNVREVLWFSQEKGKGQSGPPEFAILQRNTEQQGQTLLRGKQQWILSNQQSQLTAREIPAEHKGTASSGAQQTLQLSPREMVESPLLQIQNLPEQFPEQSDLRSN